MSAHYTDEQVVEAARLSCPCGSIAQHDPRQHVECAWAQDLVAAVVEHIAPAIAARALRDASLRYHEARTETGPLTYLRAETFLLQRADAIERGAS